MAGSARLRLITLLLVMGITLARAAPVSAHAILQRSSPAANAVLPSAPAQVELYFSEPLESGFSKIEVLDSGGKRVDSNDTRVDPADATHVTVSLGSLRDGVFTVSWDVLSASDGHSTTGSFPFAVGNVSNTALSAAAQSTQSASIWLPPIRPESTNFASLQSKPSSSRWTETWTSIGS